MATTAEQVTLGELCRLLPDALRPVWPTPPPELAIDAVHISELVDPTPFLYGHELLLTTGLTLPLTGPGMRAYVARLRASGVSGLGLGLGPVHQVIPGVLERACARQELALLEVPVEASFQQVTRGFWSRVGEAQERSLHAALDSHRRLVSAATSDNPVPSLLAVLGESIDGTVYVTDAHGAVLVAWPESAEATPALTAAVHRVRSVGHRSAATFPVGESIGSLHPIVVGDAVEGYLCTLSTTPLEPHNRGLLLAALAMLGLDAHHRRRSASADTILRSAVAHLVDRGHLPAVRALAQAGPVEAPPARVRLVVVRAAAGRGAAALEALIDSFADHGWWGSATDRIAWAMVHPGVVPLTVTHVQAVLMRIGPEAVASIGPLTELTDVHPMRTRLEAQVLGLPGGTVRPWGGGEGMPFVTDDWAHSVLAPLRGRVALLAAVSAYLRHRGNWERAARELGLHRNSIRSRIAQAERLLGGDLADPDLAARLWVALRATALDASREP